MAAAFPAILSNLTGNVNQHKVTFVIEKEFAAALSELAIDGIGKQYLVIAYEVGEDAEELKQLLEKQSEGREQLMRQMYAIVGSIAEECQVSKDTVKLVLKSKLQSSGTIKESLGELTENGLAQAIFLLKSKLSARNFDYDSYEQNLLK